jgi:hypothetical protein
MLYRFTFDTASSRFKAAAASLVNRAPTGPPAQRFNRAFASPSPIRSRTMTARIWRICAVVIAAPRTNAQPGWRDARWLGCFLTNSAFVLGGMEMLVLATLLGQERAGALLRRAVILLLVLNLVAFVLLVRDLRPALSRVYTPRQLGCLGVLCIGVGGLE